MEGLGIACPMELQVGGSYTDFVGCALVGLEIVSLALGDFALVGLVLVHPPYLTKKMNPP